MPKPFYGEYNQLADGEYKAVITEVVSLGHQSDNKGVYRSKVYIGFELVDLGVSKPLNTFGINTWLTPNKPPFVGLYEVITAVEKRAMEREELEKYDVFALAGKSVMVTLSTNERGFINVSGVSATEETYKPSKEVVAVGVEDFGNNVLLENLPEKVQNLIRGSKEYMEQAPGTLDLDKKDDEIKVEDIPF